MLVGLGAINRYRSIPAVFASTRGLRRVGGVEPVALAAAAAKGSYQFDVTGTAGTGDTIQGTFTIPVH